MTSKLRFVSIIAFIVIFVSFLFRSYYVADPDFPWHLRMGELILRQGIPQTDPFSYTMPSYRFVDHEWFADIIVYLLFTNVGIMSLHILFAFIGTSAVVILWKYHTRLFSTLFVFLMVGTLFDFVGIRMQIFTWFFLAVLMTVLSDKIIFRKYRYALPMLFLLWANLHGGFAIGFIVLTLWTIGTAIEVRRFDRHNYLVLFLSFLATFINPYGYHLWNEVSKSLFDPSLRFLIQEWYPAAYSDSMTFWVYFAISVLLMARYRSKFSRTEIFLYLLVLVSAMASMRNIPVYMIVSYGMTIRGVLFLMDEAKKYTHGKERFTQSYAFFCIIASILCFPQLLIGGSMLPKLRDIPPTEAVSYLKENIPKGNILTPYGYGGFFILHFPEKKVFIDGRMPSWRNPSAPATESTYALREFVALLTEKKSFDAACAKYSIDTVVVPASDMLPKPKYIFGLSTEQYPQLEKLFSNVFTFSFIVPHIRQSGWKEVYKDEVFVIFKKN